MKRSGKSASLLAVAFALAMVACQPQTAAKPAATGEPIKVGAVVPLTGRYAGLGAQVRPGYEIAVEDINAAGGVDVAGTRRPLELKILDDESDPAKTVQRLETLYSADRVVAYLGGAGSDLHAAGARSEERRVGKECRL